MSVATLDCVSILIIITNALRQYALVLQECSMPDSGRAAYTKAHNENLGKLIPL